LVLVRAIIAMLPHIEFGGNGNEVARGKELSDAQQGADAVFLGIDPKSSVEKPSGHL
jgi:hypothetical protein